MTTYPKRLIEVDLPIKRISAHARREKSIRHGHISTLHIWWARRPLAACRAVLCAALWLDPADELCPQVFRNLAADLITAFAMRATTSEKLSASCSPESLGRWLALAKPEGRLDPTNAAHLNILRDALLDFIADFANWDNSTVPEYLETARVLTQVAHLSLSDFRLATLAPHASAGVADFRLDFSQPNVNEQIENLKSKIANFPRPLVVDPFAGGGAIPLEALRIGADAFASDLNPIAVLLNKVVLEYIPKYGQRLADEVRKWGEWIKEQAEKELGEFYPKDPDGATPIAYLWARTITCEGPGCGAQVPLMRGLWLAKKGERSVALQIVPDKKHKRIEFEIIAKRNGKWVRTENPRSQISNPSFEGTVKRGSATCPVCGYTTPVASVRKQLKARKGGAADARLFAVVTTKATEQGRFYRLPTERDLNAVKKAAAELKRRERAHRGALSLVPDETLPVMSGVFNAPIYGHNTWGSLFTSRQALALTTIGKFVRDGGEKLAAELDSSLAIAVQTCLAMALDKQADSNSSLCSWRSASEDIGHTFGRQALPMLWDFVEGNVLGGATRDWLNAVEGGLKAIGSLDRNIQQGHIERASATTHPLPDDAAQCFFSDPPYYNAVPYADLSDFFYVWMRRTVGSLYPDLFRESLSPKEQEICEMAGWDPVRYPNKDKNFFEKEMGKAMAESRRVLAPNGIGVVVFAHKSTSGWEAQLQAMVDAGWTMTGSWPIDTEMGSRLRAMNSAALASSVHLVCRPRENPDGSLRADNIGDWRDVLAELPQRIHAWMPRLAQEGVVGADAIFACLGPALEIFSRYARVEKASGEQVTLLEYVWAAVAKEALNVIFAGADATGFEEDARLTAMWLWTLATKDEGGRQKDEEETEDDDETDSSSILHPSRAAFILEFDTARKIAQGLGAHLERLTSLIEVKGDKARLLPVAERARHLFGKDEGKAPAPAKRKTSNVQLDMFKSVEEVVAEADDWGEKNAPPPGATVLDRVHEAMILFAAGRSDALKRFLVENGAGSDERFWRLAQAFSALYPSASDEKRWVDGVLARKKGLGF